MTRRQRCLLGLVRAVDIRDPYAPRAAAFYIPATTERTAERCVTNGNADRANTGLHIVRLTGEAAKIIAGN